MKVVYKQNELVKDIIINKILIESAIRSAINLISNEMESLTSDDLQSEYEIVLVQLNMALKEFKTE